MVLGVTEPLDNSLERRWATLKVSTACPLKGLLPIRITELGVLLLWLGAAADRDVVEEDKVSPGSVTREIEFPLHPQFSKGMQLVPFMVSAIRI